MTDYEVYAAPSDAPPPVDETPWQVLVEYSNGGQAKPPTRVDVHRQLHPNRESALAAARRTALEYDPPDPLSPQGRQVYRDGPDGFIAIIQGAMSTFHMSVRVVQLVGRV